MQEMKRRSMLLLSLLLAATMAFSLSAVMPSSADAAGEATPMIAAGDIHSLALKSNGTVWAWGSNSNGQLGNNSTTDSNTPVQVSGLTGVTAIAAGGAHSLALKSDGTVWTWGLNYWGQLGNGGTTDCHTPVKVSDQTGLTGVTAIAAGSGHSVALKSDGTVWAWGENGSGQLGNGGTANSSTPVKVPGLTGVIAISAGNRHSLALKSNGEVWAWGCNDYGELGNGGTTSSSTPVKVSDQTGLTGVTAIAAGTENSIALKNDGTVWAWGEYYSGQDDGATILVAPMKVSVLTDVTAISAGGSHPTALKSDGTVWAWGWNGFGLLGDGSNEEVRSAPVKVSDQTGLTDAIAISAGGNHSLALKSDGTVWGWGADLNGQLDWDGILYNNIPVQVFGLHLRSLKLSEGSTDRTSDTSAKIGFTASLDGIAYYVVLERGADAPSKERVRSEGTLLGEVKAGKTASLPVTLTAGAKDVYVVVESTDMNEISEPLKIETAAWKDQEKGSSDNSMIIIAAAVLALVVVGFLVYWFVIRKRTP